MASSPKIAQTSEAEDPGKKRTRSPAYPFISLETAIKRAKEFYDHEKRNAASLKVAVGHWNYEEKSSGGLQTAAALISFGLMKDEGTGAKRKLQLTPNAIRLLLDERPDSGERSQLLKQMALTPKIHTDLWTKWGNDLPSEPQMRYTLTAEWEPPFNENAVDSFIREYKDTISFAKLAESDKVSVEDGDKPDTGQSYVAKVGDWVQVEANGTLRLPEPKRVREFSSDGKWAFVEGQFAGIPIEQLIPEKAPVSAPQQKPESHVPTSSNKLMQEYVVPLSGGARAVFQWPTTLSKEDIEDLQDTLKVLERKIIRSVAADEQKP